ncbi:MAG: hypothetical protein ABIL49_04145 [candidate division WOR-3 bacterium]
MTTIDILRDIVENKKSGLLKVDAYIFLFKEGLLLEVSGKSSNREEAIKDIIENDYKDGVFQEVDTSVLISFQEPLDISNKIPKKKGREIKLDESLIKKIEEIKITIPSLKKCLIGKIKGEILAYVGFSEEEIEDIVNSIETIYEKFSDMNEIILGSEKSVSFIRFKGDMFILCILDSLANVGILRVLVSGLLK